METNCIECDATITFQDNVVMGEIAQCPECGVEVEVVSTSPLKIELAPEIEEDWGE